MKLFGYVQAGGGSTRFGRDKALVELQGKTMLARTTELLWSVCEEVKIVAANRKYSQSTVGIVEDRWPGEGPLGGILSALLETRKIANEPMWSLIVSCDMPFLSCEFLGLLKEHAFGSGASVVVPESENGLEPLCACWRSDAAAEVQTMFDAGVRKVSEAMKRLPMVVLDEGVWKRFDSDQRLFWNMNTPADFEEARRILDERAR
ncbi:MAG: molybdenum cofactor guanylyltransferase [Candidatus Acidiferrum sp.]